MSDIPPITVTDEQWVSKAIVEGSIRKVVNWAEARGEMKDWRGRSARTIAGRVLGVAGDYRGSRAVHWWNFREHPDSPTACFYATFGVQRRFGSLRAIQFVEGKLKALENSDDIQGLANLRGYLGSLYSHFRDFDRAYVSLDQADHMLSDDAWLRTLRSDILLAEDRTEESFVVAEEAMELAPKYRASIVTVADHYWNANRDDEAFELLLRKKDDSEGPGIMAQLTCFYDEVERYEDGLKSLVEYEARATRADADIKKWIAGFRASFHYQLGNGPETKKYAEQSDSEFCKSIAKRVDSGEFEKGKRVRLNVGFVRQHEMTCAPATLSAVASYWGRTADHLDVAEEICYDGTPAHKERLWAIEQGYHTTEFRADFETTMALIDAGIPFTLATVEATSAHLQAIIGYDSKAGTIIIRDPNDRHYREILATEFFKDYRSSGPRALLFVPREKAVALQAIDLPEESLYTLYDRVSGALENHDRAAAAEAAEELKREGGKDHRLAIHADWALAAYDDDPQGILHATEKLTELFPDDDRQHFNRFRRSHNFEPREIRLEFLRKEIAKDDTFTLYYKELAGLLADDSRTLDEALYYYRRALHYRRRDAETLSGLAGTLWNLRKHREATDLYRYAFCLAEKSEYYADSYFKACRFLGETESALDLLRKRFTQHGSKSSGPAITLCRTLEALDRDVEISEVLNQALEWQPDDAELLIFAGRDFAARRDFEKASSILEQARGRASASACLRLEAQIAGFESRPEDAITAWKKVAELEPMAMDAHRSLTRLIAETEGTETAITRLSETCQKFPHHVPLMTLLIEWQRSVGPNQAEATMRDLISKHPTHAWTRRELVLELLDQGRMEEALAEADTVVEMNPLDTSSHSIRGFALEDQHELEAAHQNFRKALEIDVENGSAMRGFIRTAFGSAEQREAIAFIEEQFAAQVLYGEALHTFRNLAYALLAPEELLSSLQRIFDARPDLWEIWSVMSAQLIDMGQPVEAKKYALGQTERFPLMPRGWMDLAAAHRDLGEIEEEIVALEQALVLNPQWDRALRELGEAWERLGDFEKARDCFQRAVKENPLGPANRGYLGDLQWRLGERDDAFDTLVEAIRHDPTYGWGWSQLADWAGILDRGEEVLTEADLVARERPMEEDSWTRLAQFRGRFASFDEQIAALDEGLEFLPLGDGLHDYKAQLLSNNSRFEEAIAAARGGEWPNGDRPYRLAGREAWIEAARGNRKSAIVLMKAVVEAHEDYYWGHQQLSEWYLADKNFDDAIGSAQQLVRLRPLDSMAHGFVADVLLEKGDKDEAVKSLTRAFQLSPTYTYAGYQLIKYLLEKGELDEAGQHLLTYDHHNPDDPACPELRIWLETLRKNREEAMTAFGELCRMKGVGQGFLARSEEKLEAAGLRNKITGAYYDALASGEVQAEAVASQWAARAIHVSWKRAVIHLQNLKLEGDVRDAAWRDMLYALTEENRHIDAVSFFRKNRKIFESSMPMRGAAAYSLRQAGKHKLVLQIMSGWQLRDDVKCWMMTNLALSTFEANGLQAAGKVHEEVANTLPIDSESYLHFAAAAFSAAHEDRISDTKSYLDACEFGVLDPYYQMMHRLSECMIAHAEEKKTLFTQALQLYPDWRYYKYSRLYVRAAAQKDFASLSKWVAIKTLILSLKWNDRD